jgi:hypothetical protein
VVHCGLANEICLAVLDELNAADADFAAQGFAFPGVPRLRCASLDCSTVTQDPLDIEMGVQVLDASECRHSFGGHLASGTFNTITGAFTVCVPSGGIPSDDWLRYTVRHHLFHAVQFRFPLVRHAPAGVPAGDVWVIEGTADAAVESGAAMRRTEGGGAELQRALRRAEVTLTDDHEQVSTLPYETQDFWVYLFQASHRSAPLGELKPFFELGASTESVAVALENSGGVQAFGTLGQEYWGWVKNQVMEKTDVKFENDDGTTALKNPCQLELGLIGRGDVDEVDISWPTAHSVFGGLEPLQAEAVKIEFTELARNITILAVGGGGPDGPAYKVYLVGEAGCEVPGAVPDSSPRTFEELPAGSVVYVVLASVQHQDGALPPLYQVVIRGIEG